MRKQGYNLEKVKTENRFAILRLLFKRGPMSRKDIASAVGLTPASVTIICNDFIEEDIIIECGEAAEAKRAGRKKILLDINARYKYVLCAAIETDESYLSITDLKGTVIASTVIETDRTIPVRAFLTKVAFEFQKLMWETELIKGQILSVAVSVPGYVSREDERYMNVPKIWKEPVPIKEILARELGLHVEIDNNLRAYAKAELIFGDGPQRENLLIVKWGPGVGAAIITNNSIYEGAHGMAAEIGQIIRQPLGGAQLKDGHLPTLEDEISTHDIINCILQSYGETEEEHERMPLFKQWLEEGNQISYKNTAVWGCIQDENLQKVIDRKIEALVFGVANTAIVMDPDRIVAIGYLFDVPGYFERFKEKLFMMLPLKKDEAYVTKSNLSHRQDHTEALAAVIDRGLRVD